MLADRLRAELSAGYRPAQYTGELAEFAAAFRSLAEADREVLALVGWEGLDRGQAAAALGCSRNALRIRLHRARRRLADACARHQVTSPSEPVSVTNGESA